MTGGALQRFVSRSRNASAVSDAPRSEWQRDFGRRTGRIRYSCLKEASRGNCLCKFNGVAVMRKTLRIGGRANRSIDRIGSMVVCVRKFQARSLVWGNPGRTTSAGDGKHRGSEIAIGVSCSGSDTRRRRTELELSGRKSLDDHHGPATFRTAPKRARFHDNRCFLFYLRLRCGAE